MIQRLATFVITVLSSRKFIFVIVGLLVVQAVWLAFTVQFPMAFDESYHFGIIQVYSHQWLPFITSEPAGASGFGVITRYDSYMFHYLMSFPYRLFAVFSSDWASQIIFLRLVNVALFAGGLVLFRRLLVRFNLSRTIVHVALLMFVLIPAVPTLAATINYDNFTFFLVPILVGLTLTCISSILNKRTLPASSFALLLSVGFVGSLTKYAFVPVFAGALLAVCIVWVRSRKKKQILKSIVTSYKVTKRPTQIILAIFLVISTSLFLERYAGNLIMYHGFEPDCTQVKSLDSCLTYGPWGRNYTLATNVQDSDPPYNPNIVVYPFYWVNELIRKLYFTINYDFKEYAPLPIPITLAWVIGSFGTLLTIIFWRSIITLDKRLLILMPIIGLYLAGLFYATFIAFIKYHTPVAINGRYLIPILPFILIWLAVAYQQFFKAILRKRARHFSAIFSVVILLLALQGGGAMTYLLRSQPIWYWQYPVLITINTNLKSIIKPLVIDTNDSSPE